MTCQAPTALEDIKDVAAFSATVVRRSIAKRMSEDEIQEAIAEGVTLLYELHERWDPARCASFYRYCVTYLQLRLIDWWRREARQRNLAHRDTTNGTYTYHGRVSLDEFADSAMAKELLDRAVGVVGHMDSMLITQDSHRLGD